MTAGIIDPATLLAQTTTLDVYQLPSGTAGSHGGRAVGDVIASSVAKLRAETASLQQNMEAMNADKPGKADSGDAFRASYSGTDPQSMDLRNSMAPKPIQSDMPHRSDMDISTERNIATMRQMATMSHGMMTFTLGTSIATKSDGAIKMFVQAQ